MIRLSNSEQNKKEHLSSDSAATTRSKVLKYHHYTNTLKLQNEKNGIFSNRTWPKGNIANI